MVLALLSQLLALAAPSGGAQKIAWRGDSDAAYAQAQQEGRPLQVLFTGIECGEKAGVGDPLNGNGAAIVGAKDFQDRCELLEADVLSQADVVSAAAGFVPVQGATQVAQARISEDKESLTRRYHVATVPTLLFADPWGNEILRLVGRIPKDAVLRVLASVPKDFAPLQATGPQLSQDPANAKTLVAHAAFYQKRGVLTAADRLYELALRSPDLKADVAERRQVAIARGMTLMQMDKAADAAKLFEATLGEAPDGPASDALTFGWMMAEIHAGKVKEARSVYAELEKRFPTSPFTAKAKQNLDSVTAKR